MFEVTYAMKTVGRYETLKEATKAIYDLLMKENTITLQLLETMIWVEDLSSEGSALNRVMCFYRLRDNACAQGWIKNGKWVE